MRFASEGCTLVNELRRTQLRRQIRMNMYRLPKPAALAFELLASDLHQVAGHIDSRAIEHEREEPRQIRRIEALDEGFN